MKIKEMRYQRLYEYLKAESAILSGQEYTIGDRRLRRADLAAVQAAIRDLTMEIESAGQGRVKRTVLIE